ncbi:MAG: M15 family metallopeptidase [Olleya sp.]
MVTNAQEGDSFHNYGLAVDICLLLDRDKNGTFEEVSYSTVFDGDNDGVADWLEVVKIFTSFGWQWGLMNKRGKRYDLPHFQKTFGYKTWQLNRFKKDKNGYPILNV